MANINQDGITSTTLSEYKTQIEQIFTNAFGSNFNLDPETAQGQMIGLLALAFSQSDDSIIDMFNGTDIYSATGIQIDYIVSNLGISRKTAQNSEAVCTLTGVVGTIIPIGATAEDTNGNKYKLKTQVTIPAGNSVDGIFVCQTPGAIDIQPNTITKVVDVIQGWETITNPLAGITGYSQETDSQLRARYITSVASNSVSQLASIKACISSIQDVKQVEIVQNDEDIAVTVKGLSLPNHSITTVVLGGTDEDIGTCLGMKKPVGIKTNGDIEYQYTDASYYTDLTVKFYRATTIPIEIDLTIETDQDFPSDGLDQLKDDLVTYFDNQKIGKNVIYSRLYTPINLVPGHEVTSLTIGEVGQTLLPQDVIINLNEIATLSRDDISITVI